MAPELYVEMAAVQQDHWWYAARRDVLAAVIGRLGLPQQAAILEIGCGTGANLRMLCRFGALSAMEYDASAAEFARGLQVCRVESGGLPELVPYNHGSFDLVCMLDVLEHIEDDASALRKVAQLLRPGGRLLVTVPAYQWLWSEHDTLHHHYRRYTSCSLRARASEAGFAVERAGYFNTLLFPVVALVRGVSRVLARPYVSDSRMPAPWLNHVLRSVFGAERWLVARCGFPFGVSVIAVLQRPE